MNNAIIKIGQFPSIADIEIHNIDKYRKLLKNEYRDFSKAIGLYANGIGAGSLVYLRRIFENLIDEKREIAASNPEWDNDNYQRAKMDEKIKMLKSFLPPILVENRKIYGLMSKGIHELSEKTCKDIFPNIELGIELILDTKLAEIEKKNKEHRFRNFISNATQK